MASSTQLHSVDRWRAAQRYTNAIGASALILCALAFGAVLAAGISPAIPLLGVAIFVGILGVGIICRAPVVSVYTLVFTALFIEQWGITGLSPITAQTHFFETLAGFSPVPISVSPAEMVLFLTLAVILLPALAKQGRPFVKGSLFIPILFFLAAVALSFLYGVARGPAGTAFNGKAAWTEARSFVYLAVAYLLTCNLLIDRKRLHAFVWCIIVGIGLKGVQGIQNYVTEKQQGLALEAITGHEDVLFFATFYVLLAGMMLHGSHRRQRSTMLCFLLPITFTLLATKRRIGFIVLAVGMVIIGLSMLQTKKAQLFKVLPPLIMLLAVYGVIFWNAGGVLGQPVRAFRSQIGQASERDRLSNEWRELEKTNIVFNIKGAPLTGLGFGRPYSFVVAEPSLDASGFIYWHYITHNAILWVWMKMGTIGFVAFWYLFGAAVVQGFLIFRNLSDGYLRSLALLAVSLTLMQLFFSYGDLGLTYARNMIYLGCVFGMLVSLPALDRRGDRVLSRGAAGDTGAGACPPQGRHHVRPPS